MFEELTVAIYLNAIFLLVRRGGHWMARAALVAGVMNTPDELLAALAAARKVRQAIRIADKRLQEQEARQASRG